jgi:hypothetical protein
MEKNHIGYQGRMSSEVRIQLLDLLKVVSLANLGQRNDLKKLCGIALELLDNAQRYGTTPDVNFEWRIEGSNLVVSICNHASKADAERLVRAVENINSMTAEEVAAAFRAQLVNEGFGEKGGAGLGMLQIAKKTGSRLSAHITPANGENYLCVSEVAAPLK